MSPVVRIPETSYKRLESHAIGFDTPSNVIDRLLDFFEENSSSKVAKPPVVTYPPGSMLTLDPDNPGDLTHTKIIKAQFGNEAVKNWMQLIYAAHKYGFAYFADIEALQEASYSNIKKGSYSENGYHACPDLKFSIQGENANNSWRNALHLAREMNISQIEVVVQWRSNKKSAHPGQKGKLYWEAVK